MFLSMNWIGDFVDLTGVDMDDLMHKFTMGTAEVEGYQWVGKDVQDVVVGKIISCEKHPDSRKLHLLKVDVGDKVLDIVCGAPNARVGIKVPVALPGGKAGGMDIEPRMLAGCISNGMCCSQKELGVSDDHSGLWELPEDLPLGKDLKEIYEIDDFIFEVDNKSLTNRPDLWGHYGIAREVAALTGRTLKPYQTHSLDAYVSLPEVPISVEDDSCYRYSAMAISNITVPKSPENMQIRLYRCGMRGINLLTDLTNYLMLELGQPMHAYDYKRVSQIEVKKFDQPFQFTTLDDKVRTVGTDTLMICSQGKPVCVAGIMGGQESEIVDDTDSFLLECANFDSMSVRKSTQALGLRTDAALRYEKTLDPEMTRTAVARYLKLLLEIDPDVKVISRFSDCYKKHYPHRVITIDKDYVDRYTGIDISEDRITKTLTDLGFGVTRRGKDFIVDVPSYRATKDVTIPADLIEEISRIYGYDNFAKKTTRAAIHPITMTPEHRLHRGVKNLLAFSYGSHEVHTYIWNDGKTLGQLGLSNKGILHLTNAVSPDIDTIREEMVPSLICVAAKNKTYAQEFSVFEIGSVVTGLDKDNLAIEEKHLGVVLVGQKGSEEKLVMRAKSICESIAKMLRGISFYYTNDESGDVKEWEHPYNAFTVMAADEDPITPDLNVGRIAIVHPSVSAKINKKLALVGIELNMDAIWPLTRIMPKFQEPSRFPSITADITYQVDSSVRYSEFMRVIAQHPSQLLKDTELMGIYEDPDVKGKKAVTIRYTFGADDRTLTSEEVTDAIEMYRGVMRELGAMVEG